MFYYLQVNQHYIDKISVVVRILCTGLLPVFQVALILLSYYYLKKINC